MRTFFFRALSSFTLMSGLLACPTRAAACGGFFCNAALPVNQSAEGIVFADNGDGTTTAIIQIQYQGPAPQFSWVLPISSAPKSEEDIGVASNLALQRLQAATNPTYTLTTTVEGDCNENDGSSLGCFSGIMVGGASEDGAVRAPSGNDGVVVEGSGVVGSFEWTVISVDQTASEPTDSAVSWLRANGYDVPAGSPKLLGAYLAQGLHLLALRLVKGSDAGSIRPIVLTYAGRQPSIPIKLTAVAANDDMGVLTWILGPSRAVPENYLSLELNEARVNWLSPGSNYVSLVSEAANDAGGQAFVTEFAGPTGSLLGQIWTEYDERAWNSLGEQRSQNDALFLDTAVASFGAWDGFWDAARAAVTLPHGQSFDEFKSCPQCQPFTLPPAAFYAELDLQVIRPVKRVQALVAAHPMITRLYTTLSADEMTLDPLFAFNPDLPALSNVHVADRIVECNPNVDQFNAPWRVELSDGRVVWGSGADAANGTWPAALASLPPNLTITRAAASGPGRVLEDNRSAIDTELNAYNEGKEARPSSDGGCGTKHSGKRGGAWLALFLAAATMRRRAWARRKQRRNHENETR